MSHPDTPGTSAPSAPSPAGDGRPIVVGWREYVSLPEWGVPPIRAKVDTGARTSAIDVADLEWISESRVRFDIVIDRRQPDLASNRVRVETDLVRNAKVKSSLGVLHTRPVVETIIRIGSIEKKVQLGLVCRKQMICRMLLGRTALVPNLVVDSSHRYVLSRRPARGKRTLGKERP